MLPVLVTLFAGMIGTLLFFSNIGIPIQMKSCEQYFSFPKLQVVYSPYLLIYGIVMPPAAVFVNYFVIRGRLSRPVLSLLRREQKESKIRNLNLGKLRFISRFQVRQMLREMRTGFTVIFGMFISLLILMLGVNCSVMIGHLQEETKEDTKFEYMYLCKNPLEHMPQGGSEAFMKTLKREFLGYMLDVTLLGLTAENPYFEADVEEGENKVVISSAVAQKYQLEKGDELVLQDEEQDRDYTFTVTGVEQYTPGLYVFMNIDSMRSLFGAGDDYYNVIFSDKELSIPADNLYAATTRADIIHSSGVFVDMMKSMVFMLSAVSVLIFSVVMYLMMKVMIDRSTFGISLVKIFGYRMGEIRKLYLNGNFYLVAAGVAVAIPLAKKMIDMIFPYMVSNVACGMNLEFGWMLYAGIFAGVLLLYAVINQMLVYRVKNILPAEVLKNRE